MGKIAMDRFGTDGLVGMGAGGAVLFFPLQTNPSVCRTRNGRRIERLKVLVRDAHKSSFCACCFHQFRSHLRFFSEVFSEVFYFQGSADALFL